MKYNERFLCSYCLLLYYILSYIPNPNLGGIPIPETDTGPAQVGADDLAGVGIAAIAPLLLADLWTMVDPIDLLDHTVGKAIESTTMTYRFDGIKTIKKNIYIYISFQMGVTRSNVSNVASWELPEVIFQV